MLFDFLAQLFNTAYEWEKQERIDRVSSIPVKDIVAGPKMHEVLSSPWNLQKVQKYSAQINQTGKIPGGSNIRINLVNEQPQLIDGHHRLTAFLRKYPNAKLGDIKSHLGDVWINGKDSYGREYPVHAHVLALRNRLGIPSQPSKDGDVKLISGSASYTDPYLFSTRNRGRKLGEIVNTLKIERKL